MSTISGMSRDAQNHRDFDFFSHRGDGLFEAHLDMCFEENTRRRNFDGDEKGQRDVRCRQTREFAGYSRVRWSANYSTAAYQWNIQLYGLCFIYR